MAKQSFLVIYKGYVGDKYWGGLRIDGTKSPIPEAKLTKFKYVEWLAQKGFGPGYYNNSGRYAVAFKLTADADFDLYEALVNLGAEFFDANSESFKARWAALKAHAKHQNKAHPY